MLDTIKNGQASGNVAETLLANGFDVRALRPYIGKDNRSYVDRVVNGEERPVLTNATATLRKDDWKLLDQAILRVARERLRLVNGLRSRGLQFVVPNGMGRTVLETETMSDISDASMDMEGLTRNASDRPEFELSNLPLPIAHKDFHFSARQIMASRNGGSPLDTTAAELATRKVAEIQEKLALGVQSSFTYGGGTVYGLTNYPSANTKALTTPTGSNNETVMSEILEMRQQAYNANYFGPYMLYNSPNYDQYLDDDYKDASDVTLRERILKVGDIQGVETLDHLTGNKLLLVQMTSDVIRVVVGMEITTVQWDTEGGLRKNFKVMGITVPQLRADQEGNCGIVYGTDS